MSKAAARLPRERFNEPMEQLLDDIQRTGREIKKARRLMLIGSDLHDTNQIANLESLDLVVVVDEMNIGIRRSAPTTAGTSSISRSRWTSAASRSCRSIWSMAIRRERR